MRDIVSAPYTAESGALSFRKLLRLFAPPGFRALLGRKGNRFRDISDRGLPCWDSMGFTVMLRADSEKQGNQDEANRSLFLRGKDENLAVSGLLRLHSARGLTWNDRYLWRMFAS